MLQKRRDLGSMPDGLGVTASDMHKGTAVVRKYVEGFYTFAVPSTLAEANDIYGFITLRIDSKEGTDKSHDLIPANKRATVYTWVKNNEWATSEFVGSLAIGDLCCIDFADNAGKVRLVDTDTNPDEVATLEVVGISSAGAGYNDALVVVKILG